MKIKQMIKVIENFILPQSCIICQKLNYELCPICRLKIKPAPQFCPICHKKNRLGLVCDNCRSNNTKLNYDGLYIYSLPQQTTALICINAMRKYGLKNVACIIGKLIYRKIKISLLLNYPNKNIVLIPWPLAKLEHRRRGYNQNDYLAQGFNYQKTFAYQTKALQIKKKNKNIVWRGEVLPASIALVISDIVPNNILLQKGSKALKEIGATKVIFIAFSG